MHFHSRAMEGRRCPVRPHQHCLRACMCSHPRARPWPRALWHITPLALTLHAALTPPSRCTHAAARRCSLSPANARKRAQALGGLVNVGTGASLLAYNSPKCMSYLLLYYYQVMSEYRNIILCEKLCQGTAGALRVFSMCSYFSLKATLAAVQHGSLLQCCCLCGEI